MRYKISFELVLDDNDPSTPDWILDAIWPSLNAGEDVENFVVELVS